MPAPPEINDIRRPVRRIEVDGQPDVEKKRESNRHIRVSGKIVINLQGVCRRSKPRIGSWQPCGDNIKNLVGDRGATIGQDNFFEQTERKKSYSQGKVVNIEFEIFPVGKLRHHLGMMQYRAGHQMGEISNKQNVSKETTFPHFPFSDISQVRNLGERIERDANRQHNQPYVPMDTEHLPKLSGKEHQVLEVPEQANVGNDQQHEYNAG